MGIAKKDKGLKETEALNDTSDQMDLIDIFRILYFRAAEYIFFSSSHGIFSRIDHMLGHKTSINKFKKIGLMLSIFDHNDMKEISYKNKTEKQHMEARKHATKQ